MRERRRDARLCLPLLLAALLAPLPARADDPCAIQDLTVLAQGGVGGTGLRGGEEGGIGGTGLSEDGGLGGTGILEEGGLGGTGLSEDGGLGGTGILGTVTGFGSLCVNGLRVHYDADATVLLRGGVGSTADLAVGQVVFIEATASDGDEDRLEAARIEIVSAVLGRIAAIDRLERRLVAGGRVIQVLDGAPILEGDEDGTALAFGDLSPGDALDVAALAGADGRLIASRIVRHAALPEGRARLAEVRDAIQRGHGFSRLSLEGYARTGRSQRFEVSGIEVQLPDVPAPAPDARVLVEGPVVERRLRVQQLGIRPGPASARPETPEVRPTRPSSDDASRPSPDAAPDVPSKPLAPSEPPSRPERPVRIERPELPIRPELPERPERPALEKPERIDRPATDLLFRYDAIR